jgi:type IV pilus assembly protein PilW
MMFARSNSATSAQQRGFSLIEMMVVVVISLMMSLAVFGVLSTSESKKRTTLAGSNADQAGSYALYVMDKQIRSAGSALQQSSLQSYGCLLSADYQGSQILPFPSGYSVPAEFAALNAGSGSLFRLAPILIASGQAVPYGGSWNGSATGSDFLIVMSGSAGVGEVPVLFTSAPTVSPNTVTVLNSVGITANTLLLLIDKSNSVTGNPSNCMIESVASTFTSGGTTNVVPLAGNYLATTVGSTTLAGFSGSGSAINLGQKPSFTLYGVGNNTTLFSYDLLQTNNPGNTTPISQAVASDVYEMKALYGVDTSTNQDGSGFSWVDPSAAPWDIADLMNGSAASGVLLHQITAIKLGFVLRAALPENLCGAQTQTVTTGCTTIKQPNPTLFAGVVTTPGGASLTYTHTITAAEQMYRFRTVEATIPIRNNLL